MRPLFKACVCGWVLAWASLSLPFSLGAEPEYTGVWKITVLSNGRQIPVWLVEIAARNGQLSPTLVSGLGRFAQSKIAEFEADTRRLRMVMQVDGMTFVIHAYPSTGKALLGSVTVGSQRDLVRVEPGNKNMTDLEKQVVQTTPAGKAFFEAAAAPQVEERVRALQEVLAKFPDDPICYTAAGFLVNAALQSGKKTEAAEAAQHLLRLASKYGPEMEMSACLTLATTFGGSGQHTDATQYAERALKLLDDSFTLSEQEAVLKAAYAAYTGAGQQARAEALKQQLDAVARKLDDEFLKSAIAFETQKFKRKGASTRTVVVELFTGAQCPPCVAADVAFDAALKTYDPADVILLQYHLHIPGPDPMTNEDSEARMQYYNVNATPTVFLNGKQGPALGGNKQMAQGSYQRLRNNIERLISDPVQGQVSLSVHRTGDTIQASAETSKLQAADRDLRLRFVLIEDVVRYAGRNGQRLHHHVVRDFIGGAEGFPVKSAAHKETVTLQLADLRKELLNYWETSNRRQKYPDAEKPVELKKLKVVALIQDEKNKEILCAAQADVP
ncbi:MAG: hypothetical protein C4297_05525 [Gemmataceae bacterium]